ncbi:MAG: ABC transporter permease [Thermoguttaceae bacterium]|jgi:putative ABC transport system permease protein
MKLLPLIFKNLCRNPLRSVLTALGTMMLVCVVTLVWSVLWFIDRVTTEKNENLKAIVTERWSIPSRLPLSYAASLAEGAAQKPGDVKPADSMTWQFYGGSLDPQKLTRESMIFGLACDPEKLATMMDGLDELSTAESAELQRGIQALKAKPSGIILGQNHLLNLNKMIGDVRDTDLRHFLGKKFTLYGFATFKELDLEFEVVGVFPPGRYDNFAAFNRDYYNNALDSFPQTHGGRKHPWAERSLSLVWLKLPDMTAFHRVAAQISQSPLYADPPVKCETASSGMAAFLDSFRDLLWIMRRLLAPFCLATLALVIANAISISVRERRLEMAVLKVLGFGPKEILSLVLGEALLLGTAAGTASAALTYAGINWYYGGVKFPVAFFGRFLIPDQALWWGAGVGAAAALLGSLLPAWSASRVKPAEVFAKVA